MIRTILAIATIFILVLLPLISEAQQKIQITSMGFRAIPWSNTSYIPGQSNTACYGTGTVWGNNTDLNMNCSTVTSPDVPITVSKLFVYNQVESGDYQYLITCTRNWIGSNCTWMNVGESFEAEESGDIMNVYAYMSYKDQMKGKLTRVKFDIRNKTPKIRYQSAQAQPSYEPPKISTPTTQPLSMQQEPENTTIVWPQEPIGFRDVPFGITHEQAKTKQQWMASECAVLYDSFCTVEHTIGAIQVKSHLSFKPEFSSVLIEFSPENFDLMKAIFIEKYGQPHASLNEKKKNGDDELNNEVLSWRGNKVSVTLEKYFGTDTQKYFGKDFQSTAFISTNDSINQSLKHAADDF